MSNVLTPLRGWEFVVGAYPQLTQWATLLRRSAANGNVQRQSLIKGTIEKRPSNRLSVAVGRPVLSNALALKGIRAPLTAFLRKW